jgi:hypothetical protein
MAASAEGPPGLEPLSDDDLDSLEYHEISTEEHQQIISDWVADLPQPAAKLGSWSKICKAAALALPSVAPDVADDEPPNFEEYCKKLHHFFKEECLVRIRQ